MYASCVKIIYWSDDSKRHKGFLLLKLASFVNQIMTQSTPQLSLSGKQIIVHVACFFGIFILLGLFFQKDIEAFATDIITQIGLTGLIGLVVIIETFPTPIGAAVPMYIAVQGGYSPWMIGLLTSATSIASGHLGYWLGHTVGFPEKYERLIETKWPSLYATFRERGAVGIAIASMLPIPLCFLTWTSGAIRMNYLGFSMAMLTRCPKQMLYVLSIIGGISLTT
jgi:membrane protein YqaA with SNARE-associated domain